MMKLRKQKWAMNKNELKTKNVKARVKLLKAIPYKGCMVYIRMIDTQIFMYDLVYKNEIYSSNIIFTPRKGQAKLSNSEIAKAASIIWSGAITTIETLLGNSISGEKKKVAETFVGVSEAIN